MKTFKKNALRSNGGVREPEFARINRIGRIDGCPDFNEEEYTGFSRDARAACMIGRNPKMRRFGPVSGSPHYDSATSAEASARFCTRMSST